MKLTDETKNFLFILTAILVALFAIKYFDISYPLTITTTTKSAELAVVGEGKIEATPDTAFVDAGIQVENAQTVEVAQQTIETVNNKIIEAMKTLAIKKEDIKTSNYSITPNYSYEKGGSKITGYNGNATTSIKVRDIKQVAKVISQATSAGANQVSGARFTIDDPAKYREEARNKAIENARQQAAKLAKTLGITLGRVVNIVESTPNQPYYSPLLNAPDMVKAGGSEAIIEPGTQTITSTVTLYFEKK